MATDEEETDEAPPWWTGPMLPWEWTSSHARRFQQLSMDVCAEPTVRSADVEWALQMLSCAVSTLKRSGADVKRAIQLRYERDAALNELDALRAAGRCAR